MITTADIEKLAELARIELTAPEKEALRKDIDGILGYVDQIKNAPVKTGEGARLKEPVRNVLRADEKPHETGANTEAIAAEFPKREGNSLKVKKIL